MTTRVVQYQERIEAKIDWIFTTTKSIYTEKGRGAAWVSVTKRQTLLRYQTLSELHEFIEQWPVGLAGITEEYMEMYEQFVGELERYDAENEVIVCVERYRIIYTYRLKQVGNKINCMFFDLDELPPPERVQRPRTTSRTIEAENTNRPVVRGLGISAIEKLQRIGGEWDVILD